MAEESTEPKKYPPTEKKLRDLSKRANSQKQNWPSQL